ncbi:hypothetical protein PMI09_02174 [Rhizobium sp. CF122]|nr:hypothetical protein PMI09_02174 [Rhizobium sp. CF122]
MATRRQIHAEAETRVDYQPKSKWRRTKLDENDPDLNLSGLGWA